MKKLPLTLVLLLVISVCFSQDIGTKLGRAFQQFEADSQMRTAISSLYVLDAKTGKVVFQKNAAVGLATASTLKIITAATAYELLGKDFRYETQFGYAGKIRGKSLQGNFYIKPSGDPTLGSWRYGLASDTVILDRLHSAIKKLKLTGYGGLGIESRGWEGETIPDGWIWQDIGNYYGAGATGFNWRENQADVILQSGKQIGDPVKVVRTKPLHALTLHSVATSAAKGTGDNAYIYFPLLKTEGIVRGTIPVNENAFTISASLPNPDLVFQNIFSSQIARDLKMGTIHYEGPANDTTVLFTHYSSLLDSIVYWFLKRSINLYGEALVKTFSYRKTGIGSTDKGVNVVRNFWKEKNIDPAEINIVDGSGLSPLNRVTTRAQVQILAYAKKQSWFSGFYDALPLYNEMKMKSGTIRGVKGFCGYQSSSDGEEYIFSFLVNNYTGSASAVVQKMYKVLDLLK